MVYTVVIFWHKIVHKIEKKPHSRWISSHNIFEFDDLLHQTLVSCSSHEEELGKELEW